MLDCVSQLPPGFPVALCSLPLWQHTLSSAQRWPCCWEACLPKERWTPVGKHLGAISSTCYLESGSWNRVGRNKADSILSLINDCWDRGAGAGLARRYRGVTSGQECAARLQGFCCAGLRESPAPCCCFPMLFPFPSLALGWVVWQRILLRQAGGGWWQWSSYSWRELVRSRHPSGRVFLPLVWITSSWLCRSFRIPSVVGALMICSGLCWNFWVPSPIGALELSSWLCWSLRIPSLVGAVVLGSWSLRIPSLVGASVLCL